MRLSPSVDFDVLVVGCGLAGITAALAAAEEGVHVALAFPGEPFSGSSFYAGAWGMGLVGPEDEADAADLERTILGVGRGVADPVLVHTLVTGIPGAVKRLEDLGVSIRRPDNPQEREFVPCFDHKHRSWYGIEARASRGAFLRRLRERNVALLPQHELVDLAKRDSGVCGAVFLAQGEPTLASAGSTVLATGGFGGLFRHHVCPGDVSGVGQGLALEAGCALINMEFMQMMPAYVQPEGAYGTVFNEKTFRWARLSDARGETLRAAGGADLEGLMGERATYGPFTGRLASREVDLAVHKAFLRDQSGANVAYEPALINNTPEFVRGYFEWLKAEKGLGPEDAAAIGMFAHASNGGIRIDKDGWTGVDGLYAAGEVTGGMHGADRLGGLSSANCLVFGERAGRAAAWASGAGRAVGEVEFNGASGQGSSGLDELRGIMYERAMVERDEAGLSRGLGRIEEMLRGLGTTSDSCFRAQLRCARAVLASALARLESRGSHYRSDFPEEDPARACPSTVREAQSRLVVRLSCACPCQDA